jgi:hypothetical protein
MFNCKGIFLNVDRSKIIFIKKLNKNIYLIQLDESDPLSLAVYYVLKNAIYNLNVYDFDNKIQVVLDKPTPYITMESRIKKYVYSHFKLLSDGLGGSIFNNKIVKI